MVKIDYKEIMKIHKTLGPLLDRWDRENKQADERVKGDGNNNNNRENTAK